MLQPKKRILSATLLIMGSMIGTGMVGMPSAQGGSGLLPSFAMLFFSWFYTLCCSRLLLEACSWLPRGAHFMSIVSHFLGKRAAISCWCFYAIYFYCAVISHIAGAGTAIGGFFRHGLSDTIASIVFTAFFAGFVYNSLQASDRLNRLLMRGHRIRGNYRERE